MSPTLQTYECRHHPVSSRRDFHAKVDRHFQCRCVGNAAPFSPKRPSREEADIADGFANIYSAQLLFEATPQIDTVGLLSALRQHCGRVEPLSGSMTSDNLSFVYPDYPVMLADATLAAQTLMTVSPTGPSAENSEAALQQTWDWPKARSVFARCRSTMLVTDFMTGTLEYRARLGLFQNVISAVLERVPCLAIHWLPSQRFISPDAYVQSKEAQSFDRLFPAVNVRLFTISNGAENETLMDTLGLAALGLPDLQCHFKGLDVSEVARVLYNSACYLFDNGDVIGDQQTIQGIRPEDHWRCQHEDALTEPARIVLDLDPGKPYAAGNRS